jgi:hypothetical protein
LAEREKQLDHQIAEKRATRSKQKNIFKQKEAKLAKEGKKRDVGV